jgi:3-dehydro-L-gulonate 2-dehydrogenase
MRIHFADLEKILKQILLKLAFPEHKATLCARIFAQNSLDGVYSHGVNRFPLFVQYVREGLIDIHAEPELTGKNGLVEYWHGHSGPGVYNAHKAMERAIELAKENGIGCVMLHHTNHWMRGGAYGWQAADAGCVGICFTNTIANMPPWGGKDARIGNNPLVIAVPRAQGHVVLDMALSQYAYGKLQENALSNKSLAVPGGYDKDGNLSTNPGHIIESFRALPIGFWKGHGLSLMLDILLTSLTGGLSVAKITESGKEANLSQCFVCISPNQLHQQQVEEIIAFTKSSPLAKDADNILYPGEQALRKRHENEKEGIPVHESVWEEILALQ